MLTLRRGARTGFAVLVAILAVLSGCSREAPLDDSVARQTLRVGTSGDYPPFSREGEGFDVAVAERLARDLGLELEWAPFSWPDLSAAVSRGDFDVAMSGVTWRPSRAVTGRMSRAVAAGGPCLVAESDELLRERLTPPRRVAVNRGGILERWAQERFPELELLTVDDNLTLPELLRSGSVDAFVTDSFEVRHFGAGWPSRCEPKVDRKVYWVTPQGGDALAERLDAWLLENEPWLREQRAHYFAESAPRDEIDHLVDLLARRLAFMPAVAAWKQDRGVPIEDLEREERVLEDVRSAASEHGLEPDSVVRLFAVQIALAKAVQRRSQDAERTLELRAIRPVLSRLGRAIAESLARVAPVSPEQLGGDRLAPLRELLSVEEADRLVRAVLAVEASRGPESVALYRASADQLVCLGAVAENR